MKTVKEIFEYFKLEDDAPKTLMSLLETIPEFDLNNGTAEDVRVLDMTMGMEYLNICHKMCDDMLLAEVKKKGPFLLDVEFVSSGAANFSSYGQLLEDLKDEVYDCKYHGFPYARERYMKSVLPIVGTNISTGTEDMGTAYYIGDSMFVTAAHCVKGLRSFNILQSDQVPIPLKEVWYPKKYDLDSFDLAVVVAESCPAIPRLGLEDPCVMDDVMTMGYPIIPGLNPILVSEKASVGSYVSGKQKTSVGQIVASVDSYLSKLDFFVINARVKGGNSGGPVINTRGRVVGTVCELPFDSQGGSEGGRYDIMGYGVCLPSKYTTQLVSDPDIRKLVTKDGGYCLKNDI